MSKPLIVLDADVLGRQRTGDESYVSALLRELPRLDRELRFAAVTRHPECVPDGVSAIELPARSQPWRMSWSLPRLLRRLRPAIVHFQHVTAPGSRSPVVVTVPAVPVPLPVVVAVPSVPSVPTPLIELLLIESPVTWPASTT